MKKRLTLSVLSVLVMLSMVLAACAPQEVIKTVEVQKTVEVEVEKTVEVEKVVEVEKTVEVMVTPTPVPSTRQGAWVDSVIFTEQNSAQAAVTQLKAGELDIYAYTVNDANLYKAVQEDPELAYSNSFGSYNELTFNPATFADGRLNPFSSPKIREAVNWLMDRNYIVQEIMGGLGVPKFFAITAAFPDYAKYVDVARNLEAYYAYNPDKAKEIITAEMEGMGATLVDGKWQFNGEPITIIILIRTEDERRQIGDYVGSQFETIGFTVDRQYKTRSEASPIWVQSDPTEGLYHIYTGGWITTAVDRDQADNFSFFYTPRDYPIPLWQAYTPTAEFDDVCLKLRNNDFKNLDERRDLFEQAMTLSLQDSVRLWLVDSNSFTPHKANVEVAYDLAGAVAGSRLWPHTVRFVGQEGGAVKIAQPGIMVEPWNPVAGSNWIYDMMPIRATGDVGVIPDPYTGLVQPQRIEKAEIVAQQDLPMAKSLDWVDLKFEAEIAVPADAWVDWDAANQKFITAGEKFPDGLTALTKSTVYYPADLWDTVKWHDGSPLTMGDFVMWMIMNFDPGKEESPIYDEAQAETVAAFLDHFKGVRIVSTDPLVIETYDDLWLLDAELTVTTWWPEYTYGPGAWHTVGLGVQADAAKELAFSADKADTEEIEWMSLISGPSMEILKKYLDQSAAENYIPYAATMGEYVTADEATARYANLAAWYETKGHFWLGTGPFYLYKVFPVEGTLMLQRNPEYPDMADKWSGFGAPKFATAEIDGPGQVTIGSEVTFDVYVTYNEEPYPQNEIANVKYLVFDAKGALVDTGEATAVADGQYQVVLSADITSKLEAGANKLEIAISPLVVSIPTFVSYEFVTTP
ncbi:MAG: ABC transporter substrate-binding protein [Chloroflexota bacterium]